MDDNETELTHVTIILVQGGKTRIVVIPRLENPEFVYESVDAYLAKYGIVDASPPPMKEFSFKGKPHPNDQGVVSFEIDPDQMYYD